MEEFSEAVCRELRKPVPQASSLVGENGGRPDARHANNSPVRTRSASVRC